MIQESEKHLTKPAPHSKGFYSTFEKCDRMSKIQLMDALRRSIYILQQIGKSVEDSRRTRVLLRPNFLESVWGQMELWVAYKNALNECRARVIVLIFGDIDKMKK